MDFTRPRRLWPVIFLLVLGAVAREPAFAADAKRVGEVTFVIGVAHRTDSAGATAPVSKGMQLGVADLIETDAGGHVHLRFTDGAFISVRPGSRLRIDEYRVGGQKPQDTAVRFTLERGVARSITGEAARIARDRFRLNTPIAAIGIRGTDFVVLADRDAVRVTVNSGVVVLAPFGQGCSPDALGPCSTPIAVALSADMGRTMLEYQQRADAPRLIGIGRDQVTPDQAAPPASQEPRAAVRGAASESLATQVLASAPAMVPPPATPPPAAPPPAAPPPAAPPPAAPPPAAPPPAPVEPPALVWGRYAQLPVAGDDFTVPYATARPGNEPTVGNDDYLLIRRGGTQQTLSPGLGRADFSLKNALASFTDTAGVRSPASVDGGWLRIDFNVLTFATGLEMSHSVGGSHVLNAEGYLRDDGVFAARHSAGGVAGATSLDGKEAAYLFERFVPRGTFSGITIWKR